MEQAQADLAWAKRSWSEYADQKGEHKGRLQGLSEGKRLGQELGQQAGQIQGRQALIWELYANGMGLERLARFTKLPTEELRDLLRHE